ncbi:triple tyrosine motif-containing protein [Undibacterium sp.]|uniref:sensor histidine kinase n=1 Tax=Undibacterium sp. TaxID=1914977 RepID=UPI00374DA540
MQHRSKESGGGIVHRVVLIIHNFKLRNMLPAKRFGCGKLFPLLACFFLSTCALLHQAQAAIPAATQQVEPSKITLHHTSWLPKDGAPSYVTSLAQSVDGWLWVASSIGLYRFDGVRFERFTSPNDQLLYTDISSVKAFADGSVWIGYRYGGATEVRQGRIVKHYPAQSGKLNGTTWDFAMDSKGQVWVATARGLFLLKDGEFQLAPKELGAPPSAIQILLDREGGWWLRGYSGIYHRAIGSSVFEPVSGEWGWGGLTEHPDGSIWANDHGVGGIRMLHGPTNKGGPLEWHPGTGPTGQTALDRSGRMWILRPDGVEMLKPGDAPDAARRFSIQQGLSGESGTALLLDREGNVWVGTSGGLDRFRENKLTAYPAVHTQGEALPLAVRKNGEIWSDRQLIESSSSLPVLYDPAPPLPMNIAVAQYVDPQDRLWTITRESLTRVERTEQGFIRTIVPPPENLPKGLDLPGRGLGMDAEGCMWAIFGPNLYRLKDGKWTRDGGIAHVPKAGYTSMYAAPNGVLWIGTKGNLIFSLTGTKLRIFDAKDGINLGAIVQFFWDGKTLWVGGNNGIAFWDGSRFRNVIGHNQERFQATSGIAQSDEGDLWLSSGSGVFRIPAAEHHRLLTEPAYRVHYSKFDHEDGLLGAAPQASGSRTIVSAKGKIWFATTIGLFWFDPTHPLHNDLPPPVVIKGIAVNDELYSPTADLSLPKGSSNLRIDYTALSLTMPERMQFRYRLNGVDKTWQDAENRRAAYYTELAPGHYRFQVQASNNDGVWNETGAELSFHIEPTLVQTWWFKLLVILAILALIWTVHRMRLIQVAQRAHEKFEERLDERERIARELHDTLLQSVQALVLIIGTTAGRLSVQEEKDRIEKVLVHAEAAIQEGRDHVQGLRHHDEEGGLFDSLNQLGVVLAESGKVEFFPSLTGDPQTLHTIVGEAFRAISREALTNAFLHAGATRITLQVHYGISELRVIVHDDGCGIPDEIQKNGGRHGHWGLRGMRERAEKIKAKLECHSSAETGTDWQLTLPARLAYEYHRGGSMLRRLFLR